MKSRILAVLSILIMTPFLGLAQSPYIVTTYPSPPLKQDELTTIFWVAPAYADTWFDYIGVYRLGHPESVQHMHTIEWWAHSGNFQGSFNLTGDFVLRYFDQNGTGLSDPYMVQVVTNEGAIILTVTNQAMVGRPVAVSWQCRSNINVVSTDAVGYCSANNLTNVIQSAPVNGLYSGITNFTITRPGTNVFGYFRYGNPELIRSPVTVVVIPAPPAPTISLVGSNAVISWQAYNGATYNVLSSTNLTVPLSSWTNLYTVSGTYARLAYTNGITGPHKFFIVRESWL